MKRKYKRRTSRFGIFFVFLTAVTIAGVFFIPWAMKPDNFRNEKNKINSWLNGIFFQDFYNAKSLILVDLSKQWFRDIVSKSNYTATLPDGSTQTWRNTNTFLDQTSEYYNENVKGIKTGSLSNDYNLVVLYQQHGKEFLICSLGSQSDSSRYDDVNYILKTIDESDYLTK